jgi:hypothetical protein
MEWRPVSGPCGRRPVPMVRGCVQGAPDLESAATKVLRDTKFWREEGSAKLASQREEQRALDEPSLEKAPGTILCEVGNVNSLRLPQDGSSPQGGLATWASGPPGDRLLDWTIRRAYPTRLRCGPREGTRRGRRRYQDLHDAHDGISYEILTDRLRRAERADWSCAMWTPSALRPRSSTRSPTSATRSMDHLPRSTEGPPRRTGIRSKRPGSTEPAQ